MSPHNIYKTKRHVVNKRPCTTVAGTVFALQKAISFIQNNIGSHVKILYLNFIAFFVLLKFNLKILFGVIDRSYFSFNLHFCITSEVTHLFLCLLGYSYFFCKLPIYIYTLPICLLSSVIFIDL